MANSILIEHSCKTIAQKIGGGGEAAARGVSNPLISRVRSRAFREHACGAHDSPWGV